MCTIDHPISQRYRWNHHRSDGHNTSMKHATVVMCFNYLTSIGNPTLWQIGNPRFFQMTLSYKGWKETKGLVILDLIQTISDRKKHGR